jgi:hypothetical protein
MLVVELGTPYVYNMMLWFISFYDFFYLFNPSLCILPCIPYALK